MGCFEDRAKYTLEGECIKFQRHRVAVYKRPVLYDKEGIGAAWAFVRSGSTWAQQGEKLTGAEEVGEGRFGRSVALSSGGNTALIGGPFDDNEGGGAVWTFVNRP